MTIILDGSQLTIDKIVRIARHGEKVELHPDALERIRLCRAMLEEKIQAHEIMYGVNTGIGEFSEVVLTDEQVAQFVRIPFGGVPEDAERAIGDVLLRGG